jgi:hypothetical protein
MKKKIIITILSLFLLLLLLGNAPDPRLGCEGRSDGDPCIEGFGCGTGTKICRLHKDCQDDPETELNECLYCESEAAQP